uniref:Uncharacterized protein n=1 Tax=Rhizophora mucronata TaxID=61149 RepID=A0A2P2NSJ8_RHIMU
MTKLIHLNPKQTFQNGNCNSHGN